MVNGSVFIPSVRCNHLPFKFSITYFRLKFEEDQSNDHYLSLKVTEKMINESNSLHGQQLFKRSQSFHIAKVHRY